MIQGESTISVRHHFSAGHRLVGLPGPGAKCANLHGHTFHVTWTFKAPDLTAGNVEFGHVKSVVRGWVDDKLDHGYIAQREDRELRGAIHMLESKHYLTNDPPTTETIAWEIANATMGLLPELELLKVEVQEGPSNAAGWIRVLP